MMRSAVTSPAILKRFSGFNGRKPYPKRIKPFGFLLSATVHPLDRPPLNPKSSGFQLITPYSRDPSEWIRMRWIDAHSGTEYRIRTSGPSNRAGIRIQTHSDVLDRFRNHPESKSADSEGNQADSRTIGLLSRLKIHVFSVSHIGKATNLLEQQEEGVVFTDPQAVFVGGREWEATRSWLDSISIPELSILSGVPERTIRHYRLGDRKSPPEKAEAIVQALVWMLNDTERNGSG